MSISDHIAILTYSALGAAVPNKVKDGNPLEYFSVLAYPPEAFTDLKALAVEAATPAFGGMHPDVQVGVEVNGQRKKPFAGIPNDWFVVRAVSRFAPEVYSAQGALLAQTIPEGLSAIKQHFFAGKKVRANINCFPWTHKTGGRGVSFNLAGIMDAGLGGERMAVGNNNDSGAAFAKHANPNAPAGTVINQSPGMNQQASTASAGANPFGNSTSATDTGANPFAQSTGNAVANPFA